MLRFDVGDGAGDGGYKDVEFFGHVFEGGRTRVQAVAEPDGDGVGGVVFNQAKSNAFALRYKSPNEKRPAVVDRALSSFTAIGVPVCSASVEYHTESRAPTKNLTSLFHKYPRGELPRKGQRGADSPPATAALL